MMRSTGLVFDVWISFNVHIGFLIATPPVGLSGQQTKTLAAKSILDPSIGIVMLIIEW